MKLPRWRRKVKLGYNLWNCQHRLYSSRVIPPHYYRHYLKGFFCSFKFYNHYKHRKSPRATAIQMSTIAWKIGAFHRSGAQSVRWHNTWLLSIDVLLY